MNIICIIPARLNSVRLNGKLLLPLGDKTIIQHVYDNCKNVPLFSDVIIATDNSEISSHCSQFGAKVIMTDSHHESGTDRIYEAYQEYGISADIIVNVQADEPFLSATHIQAIVEAHTNNTYDVCTGITPIKDESELYSTSVVKVVTDHNDCAMYFSRAPIPCNREGFVNESQIYKKHIGIYSYRTDVLRFFTELPQSKYEVFEKLEQLRLMEQGKKYACIELDYDGFGIDTLDDYQAALNKLNR